MIEIVNSLKENYIVLKRDINEKNNSMAHSHNSDLESKLQKQLTTL